MENKGESCLPVSRGHRLSLQASRAREHQVPGASESVDAGGKTRQLAGNRVLVQHALGRRPVQLRLGAPKGRLRSLLVALPIAVSTFLTKVRTRLRRARLVAVRFSVWRSRFSADL